MFTQEALRAELNFAQSKIQKITSEHQIVKQFTFIELIFWNIPIFRVIKLTNG